MINPKEVKIQPFYKRCFCIHKYTDSAVTVYDRKKIKRHAWVCVKCGDRKYLY